MIPVVEEYLSSSINSKLEYLKQNPHLIQKILNISNTRSERVQRYISETPIKVIRGGYPRLPAELPCICIMLSKETEAQSTLGDISPEEDYACGETTEQLEVTKRGDYYSVSTGIKPLEETLSMVHVPTGFVIPLDYTRVESYELGLISILPECEFVAPGDLVEVSYQYRSSSTEATESLWEANYRLEVWTKNGDLTVELYHILKWIMMCSRSELEGDKEIFNQKLGGGDFEPAPSYFPEFVYRRSMTFWCQFVASAPTYDVPYISDVYVEGSILSDTGGDN